MFRFAVDEGPTLRDSCGMTQQSLFASAASIVEISGGHLRQQWRVQPKAAFDAWLRTAQYVPVRPGRRNPLPPRDFSDATRRAYGSLFAQYLSHLAALGVHCVAATPENIATFLKALPGRTKGRASVVTVRRALHVIDLAYSEMLRQGLRRDHPVKPLFRRFAQRETSPQTTILLPSQHQALLAWIDAIPRDTFENARRAALLAVAIGCGVCGDELRRLKADQFKLDEIQPVLELPETSAHARALLPFSEHCARTLRDWLNTRRAAGATGQLMFPAAPDRDEPVGLQTLHRYTVAALAAVGRHDRVGAQRVLRATFAVRQLEHADEQQVRIWMRLRTDKMIERYKRSAVRPGLRMV